MNLEMTAASVIEQFPDGSRSELQKQEQMLEKFGNVAFGGFGVIVGIGICGVIYYILTNMILSGTKPLAGILLASFVVFAALSLAYVVWNETLKERRQKAGSAPGRTIEAAATTSKLLAPTHFEPASSVVEDTTQLLRARPRSGDDG